MGRGAKEIILARNRSIHRVKRVGESGTETDRSVSAGIAEEPEGFGLRCRQLEMPAVRGVRARQTGQRRAVVRGADMCAQRVNDLRISVGPRQVPGARTEGIA